MNTGVFCSRATAGNVPGSARASRAGFGASPKQSSLAARKEKVRDGGAPSPARGARALPGGLTARRGMVVAFALLAVAICSATANHESRDSEYAYEAPVPGTY